MTPTTLAGWHDVLARRGLQLLPNSTFVPVDAWLVDPRTPSRVLRLLGRGTTVRLITYDRRDLCVLLLRSECDCEEHRLAGAVGRLVLRPGAESLEETSYDGAALHGWTGVTAALLRPDEVAPILDHLLRSSEPAVAATA